MASAKFTLRHGIALSPRGRGRRGEAALGKGEGLSPTPEFAVAPPPSPGRLTASALSRKGRGQIVPVDSAVMHFGIVPGAR